MRKNNLLFPVLMLVALLVCFVASANAQFFKPSRKGNSGGHNIRLETTCHPQAHFSGLPNFVLKFKDKRKSTSILQQYDGSDSKPEVSADIEPFEFVKSGLDNYMSQLGFSCSGLSSSEISLVVTLDKFDVGYYSGKGWAANISLGLVLVDRSGEEIYSKELIRKREQINASPFDYDVMDKALNNAWNSLLENTIEWQEISVALQKSAEPKPVTAAIGTQTMNVTNIYYQQVASSETSGNSQSFVADAPQRKLSDVDENVPLVEGNSNSNTYVLIIANENYKNDLQKVNYALCDAETFKDYCIKTLGVPQKQIFHYKDATFGEMKNAFDKIEYVLNEFEGKRAIVYYCGHGTNDESSRKAYIVPVDGDAKGSSLSYSLEDIYKTLSQTKAVSITYFLDACFSGAGRDGEMLVAARGTARAPKKEVIGGITIVFSATSNDETAMAYDDKGHGLFTYYLLKALQDSKGDITYGNLYDYLLEKVKHDAIIINDKPQHPMVATSPGAMDTWRSMKLK